MELVVQIAGAKLWRAFCRYAPNPLEDDCPSLLGQTRLPPRVSQSPAVVLIGTKQQSRSRGPWILSGTLNVRLAIALRDKWGLHAD